MDKNLRVLNISQGRAGGAGISAFRFHSALLQEGINSEFLDVEKISINSSEVLKTEPSVNFLELNQIRKKLINLLGTWFKFKRLRKKYKLEVLSNGFFNSVDTNTIVEKYCKNYDVVVFHWVFKCVNNSLIKRISKERKVYIYLHDERVNYGLFHYSNDRNRAPNSLKLVDALLKFAYRLSKWDKYVVFLSPSNWLINKTLKTNPNRKIFYLPYSNELSEKSWKSYEQTTTGIVNLLFVAQSVDNHRKGNLYLKKVVEEFSNVDNLRIHIVGESSILGNQGNVTYYGFLAHDEIYNLLIKMDYFLLPSIEDNMPNVMIEALCFGCKVICFNVGGMAEVILQGWNGYLAKENTHESLLEVINEALENHATKGWEKKEMGNFYRNYFSATRQVGIFKNVHNSVTYDLF